uniref:NADH dehydrogenase subunit 6 n=1 Tax=Parasteatoda cingulata TaxID=2905676 RepID=UPI0022373A22|nr:NADH dehydrogenase subunit 6 [Parasteatoda cingulata]UYG23923.1 NADH dehydrogenase subunit 6 [Parasteatoda cingulata]
MMLMLGLMFVWSIQSYSMIVSLIMMTLGYSMFLYYSMGSYWYSYMLVLVMMSGVLVLFTYIASLIPNESFEYVGLVYASIFLSMIMMMKVNYSTNYNIDMSMILLKMWNLLLGMYNMYMVLFLLMIMVMVVWLSNFDVGAVRN